MQPSCPPSQARRQRPSGRLRLDPCRRADQCVRDRLRKPARGDRTASTRRLPGRGPHVLRSDRELHARSMRSDQTGDPVARDRQMGPRPRRRFAHLETALAGATAPNEHSRIREGQRPGASRSARRRLLTRHLTRVPKRPMPLPSNAGWTAQTSLGNRPRIPSTAIPE